MDERSAIRHFLCIVTLLGWMTECAGAFPSYKALLSRVKLVAPHWMSLLLLLSCFIYSYSAYALESLAFNIEQIKKKDWQLNNISLTLFDLEKPSQQLSLLVKQMSLPKPFSGTKLVDVQCKQFSWQENHIDCKAGKAKFKSNIFHSDYFSFSFFLTDKKSGFSLKNLKLANGSVSLTANELGENWSVVITTKNLQLKDLHNFLSKENKLFDEVSKGRINIDINASGNSDGLNTFLVKLLLKKASLQANSGKTIMEGIDFEWDLKAALKNGQWYWDSLKQINQGEIYQEPIYLDIKDKGLVLKAKGKWQEQGGIWLQQANFIHTDVIELDLHGVIRPDFNVDKAHVSCSVNDLSLFSKQYISPFFEQTAFEGVKLAGKLAAEIDLEHSAVVLASVDVKSLSVEDNNAKRFAINKAEGIVNWSNDLAFEGASEIRWEQLKIRAIPIEASQLKFIFKQKEISLLEPTSIPLLQGSLNIKQFKWQSGVNDEPKVYFEGGVNQLSLGKLSHALDWTPLSGNISGYIPGVNYENKILTLNGELKVNLFGGNIKISKLSSSGLFSDFSKFSMVMEIDDLDLFEITQKFEMGGMEGRISGFINDLYLENWEPISFYAWLGTPENDNSRHRISQKAVENIASIGGGGAANVISKGFLRFFDTFMYDRLGFGCYLHQGVCQLMGVEAIEKEKGYYLIKGGGIPRIDIIGYNTEVDWKVLMERLSRISSTDEVIIE